jgi:hypothetical protein
VSDTTNAGTGITPERNDPLHRRGLETCEDRCLVRPRIDPVVFAGAPGVILAMSAPLEQPPKPRLHGGQHLRHVQRCQTPRRMKPDPTGRVAREHAVEHQRVDVHVQIERPAEPLNDGHGPPAWLLETDGARVVPQQAEYGAQEDSGHPTAQVVVPREPVPQSVRQTQDPLSNRYVREDVIDQMHGTLGHAATTATGTERPPLARVNAGRKSDSSAD